VDKQGQLVRVFWADAICRKNYSVFGDVLSVDSTYTTNQYDMKFVPFTGVDHHFQSVFGNSLCHSWLLQLINKMSLKHSLVAKSHKKSRYIHQMISTPKGDAKELKRQGEEGTKKTDVWKIQAISGS
jgi:hypothetical protein